MSCFQLVGECNYSISIQCGRKTESCRYARVRGASSNSKVHEKRGSLPAQKIIFLTLRGSSVSSFEHCIDIPIPTRSLFRYQSFHEEQAALCRKHPVKFLSRGSSSLYRRRSASRPSYIVFPKIDISCIYALNLFICSMNLVFVKLYCGFFLELSLVTLSQDRKDAYLNFCESRRIGQNEEASEKGATSNRTII
ncbi:unnamed protein product [Albugo candida]|uniref:Uncharacterized protein n=1 Tax=Albugo candida TaxID=65357 RepID=A0A024FW48_9STRA|nr:unnamed protein product [Albugo candida]|eukprot:CCI11261.1 unnamed protein product [Albugo candida]